MYKRQGYYNITRDDLGGDFGWLENCLDDSEMTVVDWFETDTFKEIVQRRYDWAQMGYIMPCLLYTSRCV